MLYELIYDNALLKKPLVVARSHDINVLMERGKAHYAEVFKPATLTFDWSPGSRDNTMDGCPKGDERVSYQIAPDKLYVEGEGK